MYKFLLTITFLVASLGVSAQSFNGVLVDSQLLGTEQVTDRLTLRSYLREVWSCKYSVNGTFQTVQLLEGCPATKVFSSKMSK